MYSKVLRISMLSQRSLPFMNSKFSLCKSLTSEKYSPCPHSCLKSQYMEKRIFAITTLGEKISEAERNQEDFDFLQNPVEKPKDNGKEEEEHISDDVPRPQTIEAVHWFTKE